MTAKTYCPDCGFDSGCGDRPEERRADADEVFVIAGEDVTFPPEPGSAAAAGDPQ